MKIAYILTRDYKKIFEYIFSNEENTILLCSNKRYGLMSCFKKKNYKKENIRIGFFPYNPSFVLELDKLKTIGENKFIECCKENDIEFIEPSK